MDFSEINLFVKGVGRDALKTVLHQNFDDFYEHLKDYTKDLDYYLKLSGVEFISKYALSDRDENSILEFLDINELWGDLHSEMESNILGKKEEKGIEQLEDQRQSND